MKIVILCFLGLISYSAFPFDLSDKILPVSIEPEIIDICEYRVCDDK